LVNTEYDCGLWRYFRGSQYLIFQGVPFHSSRMRGTRYVVGDDAGDIFELSGKLLKLLATLGRGYITGLDVDKNGDVYFIENSLEVLYRLPKGSSVPVAVARLGFASWGVAVKGNALYVSDCSGENIYTLPKTGGSLTLFVSGLVGPCDLIFDRMGNLYIAEYGGGSIAFIRAGSTTVKRIATGFTNPYYIGLDVAGYVYFTDFATGKLWMFKPY
jgi:DNA-binding beta-propeller fold protein YncE